MAIKKAAKKDMSPRIPQKDKIDFDLHIGEFPFTENQKKFIDLALEKSTRIIFLDGPAGSSKTFLAVYVGLQMLQSKKNGEIVYVRSLVESADKGMGFLPGEASDKFSPYAAPLMDKLDEFLSPMDVKKLMTGGHIRPVPVNFMRGLSLNATTCIIDEAQNNSIKEIITILTRIGKFSKFIFSGDHQQSDIPGSKHNGLSSMMNIFDNPESQAEGIHCVHFTKDDIMRSEILKFIIGKLEDAKLT